MYQSPENTILKKKLINLKRNDLPLNYLQRKKDQFQDKQCFTPLFKMKNQDVKNDPLRNSDEIHQRIGQYSSGLKNYVNSSIYSKEQIPKNPQIIGDNPQYLKQFQTPLKSSFMINEEELINSDNKVQGESKEYLVINTSLNFHSDSNDMQKNQSFSSQNIQFLKHQITKAKRQGQKLKDQNLKLRLQKVKLTTKNTKSDTFKLIPLKIEQQNLKKEIQKLLQEKQLLLLNKKIKENTKNQPDLKINGAQFKVLKHIPGSIYSHKEIKYHQVHQQNNSQNKNSSFHTESKVLQKPSNNSSFTISKAQVERKNESKLFNSYLAQSPKNNQKVNISDNQSIRKFISSNNQSITSFFKLQTNTIQSPEENSNQSFLTKQKQGSDKRKNNEEIYKSTFIKFAKQSLKSGEKPIFQNYDKNEKNFDYRLSRQRQTNVSAACLNRTFDNILSRQEEIQQKTSK